MKLHDLFDLLRETFRQWRDEDITRMGAALAYYAAFALIPLVLVVTILSTLFLGADQAENQIGQLITQFIGDEAAQSIQSAIGNLSEGHIPATITSLVSLGALLFAATGLFRHLKDALNIIWSVPPTTDDKVKGFVKDTALSLLVVMGLGVLLLVVMAINAALFSFVRSLGDGQPDVQLLPLWQVIGFVLLFLFTALIFATIFKVLPDAHVAWGDVWIGSVVTALLFTIGQWIISLVLSSSSLDTFYGTASTVVFVLIWVHISAHIVLLGAEFTQVYANRYGSKIVPTQEHEQQKRAVGEANG